MRTFTVVLTLIVLGVASSCKKNETSYFPSVAFEQRVYLNNPSSFDLNVPGGWIYVDGGYKGLIIYRRYLNGGQDDFVALDRGCPSHYSESCATLKTTSDDLFAQCDCNNEKYLLFDGAPSDGATIGMRQYKVVRNGDVLYISN